MGDSTSDEPSWAREEDADGQYQPPGEAEPSSSVSTSSSQNSGGGAEFVEMSPASFVQAAYRAHQERYGDNNPLSGRYQADSYAGIPSSQSLAVAGPSHVYRDAESSYDHQPPPPYVEMTSGNEAQIMSDSGYMATPGVASSSMTASSAGYGLSHMSTGEVQGQLIADRVVSPDIDSTVTSDSTPGQGFRQLTRVNTLQQGVPVKRRRFGDIHVPSATVSYSQAEVSTSAERQYNHGTLGGAQGHREVEANNVQVRVSRGSTEDIEGAVSSLTGSGNNEAEVNVRSGMLTSAASGSRRRALPEDDMESGEPDTTQGDEDIAFGGEYDSDEEDNEAGIQSNEDNPHVMPSNVAPDNQVARHSDASNNQVDPHRGEVQIYSTTASHSIGGTQPQMSNETLTQHINNGTMTQQNQENINDQLHIVNITQASHNLVSLSMARPKNVTRNHPLAQDAAAFEQNDVGALESMVHTTGGARGQRSRSDANEEGSAQLVDSQSQNGLMNGHFMDNQQRILQIAMQTESQRTRHYEENLGNQSSTSSMDSGYIENPNRTYTYTVENGTIVSGQSAASGVQEPVESQQVDSHCLGVGGSSMSVHPNLVQAMPAHRMVSGPSGLGHLALVGGHATSTGTDNDIDSRSLQNGHMLQQNSCRYALATSQQLSGSDAASLIHVSASNVPIQVSSYTSAPSSSLFNTNLLQAENQSQLLANEIQLAAMSTNQMPSSSHGLTMDPVYILDQVLEEQRPKNEPQPGLSSSEMCVDGGLSSTSQDQPSRINNAHRVSRRKSSRLADINTEPPVWRKRKFNPTTYDPNHLWCDECMQTYDVECPIHKLVPITDKIVFSRAWASLPAQLQIFRVGEGQTELGVFAKKPIAKQTQFGPFVADLVQSRDLVTRHAFPLMVEQPTGEVTFFETSDENKCNWMMFVRPASNVAEQNLVAYQHGQDIFFTSIKPIEPKDELKVWYAAHYADRWNHSVFEPTAEDIQAMEEKACKYECYECPKRFRTTLALQKHLIVHEMSSGRADSGSEPSSSGQIDPDARIVNKRKSYQPHSSLRKKIIAAKKAKESTNTSTESQTSTSGIYHWKKRSTNIYLNKTLKKYQKRYDVEVMRKSIQFQHSQGQNLTSTPKKHKDIVCLECELVFESYTLYNIHYFSHAEEPQQENADLSEFQRPQDESMFHIDTDGTATASSTEATAYCCPGCSLQFVGKSQLIEHVRYHAKNHVNRLEVTSEMPDYYVSPSRKPNKCRQCNKSFTTIERLQNHIMSHVIDESKPVQCSVCLKRFMNNSALACHMKTHSDKKYYQCPICDMGFDLTSAMREHSFIHANANGTFNCPQCDKVFSEFLVLKKHVRNFHTNKVIPCPSCDKVFPRMDKLRLHMLRHSSVKEFMCDTCGRQFKRKDKLKEHIKRMHSQERIEKDRLKALRPVSTKFIPKVSPNEFHRFIYKCHLCMLGFKRRGMLVNHIAKRHPELKPDSVPELNLPILKTQRDYYCQYCDKVYKSSSKRKAHILKNHPGSELPQSARKKCGIDEIPGVPNPTYSQTVGSITTMPHQCDHCHKQYASKAKLLQHQRSKHPELSGGIPHRTVLTNPQKPQAGKVITSVQTIPGPGVTLQPEETLTVVDQYEGDQQVTDSAHATDLLTQAMTELTQSVEFRPGPDGASAALLRLTQAVQGSPAMVQIQTSSAQGAQTIELAHLSQALSGFNPQQGGMPIQVQVSGSGATGHIHIPILTSHAGSTGPGTQILAVDPLQGPSSPQQAGSSQAQQITFSPISIVGGTYIPKSWTNYTYKSH